MLSPVHVDLRGVGCHDLMQHKGRSPAAGSPGPPARPAAARTSVRRGLAGPPAVSAAARMVVLTRKVTDWNTPAAGNRTVAGCMPGAADWVWPTEH